MAEQHPSVAQSAAMPKWLVRLIVGKLVLVVAIVIGVLWYAGILG